MLSACSHASKLLGNTVAYVSTIAERTSASQHTEILFQKMLPLFTFVFFNEGKKKSCAISFPTAFSGIRSSLSRLEMSPWRAYRYQLFTNAKDAVHSLDRHSFSISWNATRVCAMAPLKSLIYLSMLFLRCRFRTAKNFCKWLDCKMLPGCWSCNVIVNSVLAWTSLLHLLVPTARQV